MIRKILTDYKFECDPITRKQITALILRNFYASLFDRIENSYYGIKNSKIIVPPTHDFESAFWILQLMARLILCFPILLPRIS